jgi:DnaD/phage-associated family protein
LLIIADEKCGDEVKYELEISSFYDWLETNPLATSSITLWHALMHTNKKAGWLDKFAVAVSVLELKTGLKRDAIYDARHKLEKAGRIKWEKRKGNQSALYEMVSFVSDKTIQESVVTDKPTQTPTQLPTQYPTQTPTQLPTIKKTLEEELEEEENACGNHKSVFSLYENNFGIVPSSIYYLLADLESTYSHEWIEAAFIEAGKAGAKSFNYIDACLKDWRDNGFKNGRRGGKNNEPHLKLAGTNTPTDSARPKSARVRGPGIVTSTVSSDL